MKAKEEPKLIRPLKKGDKIYNDLGMTNFIWYRYLCPLLLKNGEDDTHYHILIDDRIAQPIRMYWKDLNTILEKNLNSLDDVRLRQIELTEKHLKYLKDKSQH